MNDSINKFIFSLAFYIRRYMKASTVIKLSLLCLLIASIVSILTQNIWIVVCVLVVNQAVTHLLEFLYAFDEEAGESE